MKKIKKLLIEVLVVIVSCGSLLLTACGGDGHTHSYGEWVVTKQATCNEKGERQKICSCGDTKIEKTPKKGHNFVGDICLDCGEEN